MRIAKRIKTIMREVLIDVFRTSAARTMLRNSACIGMKNNMEIPSAIILNKIVSTIN